ncbi:MAG: aminotransferase class I/II-fold pyridoxal phosphate-dependent enzyme [Deltaproteobacteria bacterium]|nr:aminotransferase class I/II-fold pyridoxal phosphate-dependent enzyme [Deltaproteobacteria bacterium]
MQSRLVQGESNDAFTKVEEFQKVIQAVKDQDMYPYFQALECNLGTEAIVRGKKVIMMGSNNYLGLTSDPRVREAALDAVRKYGTSMTGSRLLNGTLELHETFEQEIADFLGKEAALVFTTGYQANLGAITALANFSTIVYLDKCNHASLYDATLMSGAKPYFFKHNDPKDLERLLSQAPSNKAKILVVDGVFSMEGDITPLPEIVQVCKKYNTRVLVDDAHAVGVLGKRGEGTAGHFGLTHEVDVIIATFSKSLASTGGYVAGSKAVIDYIKHFGRSMIFSASITPANLAAAREALKILIAEPERVEMAQRNAKKLKEGLISMGWQVGPSESPIIPVHIGSDATTLALWKDLLEAGVYINPVVYPAVGMNESRLRVSTIATHTDSHIEQALSAFQVVGERYGVIKKRVAHAQR